MYDFNKLQEDNDFFFATLLTAIHKQVSMC